MRRPDESGQAHCAGTVTEASELLHRARAGFAGLFALKMLVGEDDDAVHSDPDCDGAKNQPSERGAAIGWMVWVGHDNSPGFVRAARES